jgi:hypothetical protein
MTNWFYYDTQGNKIGPIPSVALQALAQQRIVTPDTVVETDEGKRGQAGQIKNFQFPETDSPVLPPVQPPQSVAVPMSPKTDEDNIPKTAIASFWLGLIGLIAWVIPLFGFPISMTGLVLGIRNLSGAGRGKAKVGIILCSIGLFLSVINAMIGANNAVEAQRQQKYQQEHQRQYGDPYMKNPIESAANPHCDYCGGTGYQSNSGVLCRVCRGTGFSDRKKPKVWYRNF